MAAAQTSTGRLPLLDYLIHLMSKILIVVVSGFFVPGVLAFLLFYAMRRAGFVVTSVYFGKAMFAVALVFCLLQAVKFNTRMVIRRLCAERRGGKLFAYHHPIVRHSESSDTLLLRVRRICAIAVIEAKGYTIAFGVAFLVLYLGFLYFLRDYDRASLICRAQCEVLWYWAKSIGSGPLFDFFDTFHIQLSDIDDGSYFFRTVSYLAKIVSVLLILQTASVYLRFRRRFRWVLRSYALTPEEAGNDYDKMLTNERQVFGPGRIFMIFPPWRQRKTESKKDG